MVKLKESVPVAPDGETTRYVPVADGLIAGAFVVSDQLFVRAQRKADCPRDWEECWALIREQFWFAQEDVRTESRIHLWEDGDEQRQVFLGPAGGEA